MMDNNNNNNINNNNEKYDNDGFYFLSKSARSALPKYQYKGKDCSLLYIYILSPLAQFCVDYLTPKSMAPNTITLIGLSFMLASYCLYWYYHDGQDCNLYFIQDENENNDNNENYNLPEKTMRYIYLFNTIAMLLYQSLDNMDGKQARRTNSSSPLGLLFDHGCDAVNSIFGSTNWILNMGLYPTLFQSTNILSCWILIFGPFAMFYIATWEEYHLGELILPIVNGPNEGLAGGALLSFITYLYGPQFWQSTSFYDACFFLNDDNSHDDYDHDNKWTNADFIIMAATIGFLQEIILKTLHVLTSLPNNNNNNKNYFHGITTMLPLIILCTCTVFIGCKLPNIFLRMPRTFLHLSMILFVEMVSEIMLTHITAQSYSCMKRYILLPLIVLTILVMTGIIHQANTFTDMLLLTYTSAAGTFLLMKMVLVVHEICAVLNIWCFDITTPRKQKSIK